MRRFLISLCLILLFVIVSVLFDQFYMRSFAQGMNEGLDLVVEADRGEDKKTAVADLYDYFAKTHGITRHLAFGNRLDEIETLIRKLNAYAAASDDSEIFATVEEIRARIHLLSSTELQHRNHSLR